MASLRYHKRTRGVFARGEAQQIELFPDEQRWEDYRGRSGESLTAAPLDELAFIYFLRTLPLTGDAPDQLDRHYNRDRNPITVRVICRDSVSTPAGSFATIVVEMRVKDPERYGGEGVIRIRIVSPDPQPSVSCPSLKSPALTRPPPDTPRPHTRRRSYCGTDQ